MASNHKNIENICLSIKTKIKKAYKNLHLHFVIHENGTFAKETTMSFNKLQDHPAGEIAKKLLKKKLDDHIENSQFFGLAIAHSPQFFGLFHKRSVIAVINVNINRYDTEQNAKKDIYNLVWHALDITSLHTAPQNKADIESGIVIPKRTEMNLAKANLQADVFSGILCTLEGEDDAIQSLARVRALQSLESNIHSHPEYYPYPIAIEATEFAFREWGKQKMPSSKAISLAHQISLNVGQAFSENNIQRWWGYCQLAQDMAWRSYSPEDILGSALNLRSDPLVRATAQLILDVGDITPTTDIELAGEYNAFVDPRRNEYLHKTRAETAFDDALSIGIEQESSDPLHKVANEQNEKLTEGKILGWCASALQAAAKAFENALASGTSPEEAARDEFAAEHENTTWAAISQLGESIIEQRRLGFAITLGHIADICSQQKNLDTILGSVQKTLEDPDYVRKLAPANDLSFVTESSEETEKDTQDSIHNNQENTQPVTSLPEPQEPQPLETAPQQYTPPGPEPSPELFKPRSIENREPLIKPVKVHKVEEKDAPSDENTKE